jgi:RNA polymerase sigma factor (sigma-70 family)
MLLDNAATTISCGLGAGRSDTIRGRKVIKQCKRDEEGLLAQALLSGNKRIWGIFVERFQPVISSAVRKTFRAYCSRLDEADIEDVTQEVFLRLCKADYRLLRFYEPTKASLVTWLHIIARSMALDFLRRRPMDMSPLDDKIMDIPMEEDAPPPSVEIPSELLSTRQRLVMHLLYDKELAVSNVAEMLSVDAQTVRSTRHKALVKLRRHFGVQQQPAAS